MSGVLRAEFADQHHQAVVDCAHLHLRAQRWVRGAATAVALLQSRAGVASSPFTDPGIIRSIYNGGNVLSRILAMVVGIVGGEASIGTAHSPRAIWPPRGGSDCCRQGAALLIFGVIYGITSVAAGMLVSVPFVLAHGGTFLLTSQQPGVPSFLGCARSRSGP